MNAKHPLPPFALLALVTLAPACELEGYENILVPDGGFQAAALTEDMDADELLAPLSALADEADSQGRRGYVEFGSFAAGTKCETINFATPFPAGSSPLRVQANIDHRNSNQPSRDATTVWTRWVNESSVRLCVRETTDSFVNGDGGLHLDGLGVNYWVYRQDAVDSERASGRDNDRTLTADGRDCGWVEFGQDFAPDIPVVHATIFGARAADNDNGINLLDRAPTVWVEAVESDRAKICARATSVPAGDSTPMSYAIDWYAYPPGAAPGEVSESGAWTPSDELPAGTDDWTDDERCVSQSFTVDFVGVPDVFVSVDHLAYSGHDATTVWIENLDDAGFEMCFAELADPGTPGAKDDSVHRADIRLSWTAIERAFGCDGGLTKIPLDEVCDGFAQCGDASDESDC